MPKIWGKILQRPKNVPSQSSYMKLPAHKAIIMKWIFVDWIIELMKLIYEIHSIFDLEHENFESKIFFHFCEKFYHQNLAKSFLRAQILTLEFSIVYPWKIGNFIHRMAYSKLENSNSNYSKSAFKECKELWRGL